MDITPAGNDNDIILRLKSGDKDAFTSLYRAYFPELLAFAQRYVRDAAAAEDLVQEVFLQIWAARSEFSPAFTVRSYLYAAVRNRALKLIRYNDVRARSEPQLIAEHEEWAAAIVEEGSNQDDEIRQAIAKAVASLSEKQQLVMGLKLGRGLNAVEIAEVVGISPQAVSKTMQRAYAALQELLRNLKE